VPVREPAGAAARGGVERGDRVGSGRRRSDPIGKRIVNLKRRQNHKLGLRRTDDRLPAHLLKPLVAGGAAGIVPDMPALLAGAYAELGWDPESGQPVPEPEA